MLPCACVEEVFPVAIRILAAVLTEDEAVDAALWSAYVRGGQTVGWCETCRLGAWGEQLTVGGTRRRPVLQAEAWCGVCRASAVRHAVRRELVAA